MSQITFFDGEAPSSDINHRTGMSDQQVDRYLDANGLTGAVEVTRSLAGTLEARVRRGDGSFSVFRSMETETQGRRQRSTPRNGRVRVLKTDDRPVTE